MHAYGIFFLRSKLSLRADVSGVAAGNCVVAFAEPTVPLVAAWSSGLNVTLLGSVQETAIQKSNSIRSFIMLCVLSVTDANIVLGGMIWFIESWFLVLAGS